MAYKRAKWVTWLLIVIMAIMIGLSFLFSTILLSMDNYEFFSLFIVATFLTHLCILLLTIFILFRLYNNKKLRLVFIGLISFGFIFLAGTIMYFNYDKSLEYGLENDNQLKEIVTLDKESSFKLDNNLPVLDGATALYPVYVSFANAVYPEYVKKDLSIKSEELKSDEYVKCSTTNEAYYNIINGHADIIFVALPSKEQEEMAKEKDITLEFIPIGRDAFVFFVNKKNPVNNISIDNLKKIYTGEISKWGELAELENLEKDKRKLESLGDILVFQRNKGSGSQTYLKRFMGDLDLKKPVIEEVRDFMSGIVSDVAVNYKNYKSSIGFLFRYYVQSMVDNKGIKLLSLDNIYPSKENIENNAYPLSGDFYAVIRSDASKELRDFIEWMKSDEGQEIVEKVGYVREK